MEQAKLNIAVPIEISARHIHLSPEDITILFGKEYQLKRIKKLSQAEDFSAKETVEVEINEQSIKNIRVVGPAREKTQLEITLSDTYKIKTDIPIRLSGDLEGTFGFRIIGPAGVVIKEEGAIVAKRHLHISPDEAKKYGLENQKIVSVLYEGIREIIFHNVEIRIKNDFHLAVHIDVDEANACGLKTCGLGTIVM